MNLSFLFASLICFEVLNETYIKTGRLLDGQEMAKHFLNRTFHLPTGEMFVNQDGERMCDILGDVLDPESGSFTVSTVSKTIISNQKFEMKPNYLSHQTTIRYDHKQDRLLSTKPVNMYWPGQKWPPPNEPFCGFLGNRCKGKDTVWKCS